MRKSEFRGLHHISGDLSSSLELTLRRSIDLEIPAAYPDKNDSEDLACIEFLKSTLKLGSFLSIALRTIYSVKSHSQRILSSDPEEKVVAQLDSGLDRWLKSLPEQCECHLYRTLISVISAVN